MGMVAILIKGPWPFVQMLNLSLTKGPTWSLNKIGPGVLEKKLFKGVDGQWTDEGEQVITIAHPKFCSGELKKTNKQTYSRMSSAAVVRGTLKVKHTFCLAFIAPDKALTIYKWKVQIIFLFLHERIPICCGHLLEAAHQGTSNEYLQYVFNPGPAESG